MRPGSAEGLLRTAAGANLAVSSAVTGTGGLTAGGANTITLSGTNAYTGQTTLGGGTLAVGAAAALPAASALLLVGGTVQTTVSGGVNLGNAVTFNNNATVGFAGSGPIFFSGTTTLTSAALLSVGTRAGSRSPASSPAEAPLPVQGGGTLVLTNTFGTTSNFSGQVTVLSGIVNAQQANSLGGASAVVVAGDGAGRTSERRRASPRADRCSSTAPASATGAPCRTSMATTSRPVASP